MTDALTTTTDRREAAAVAATAAFAGGCLITQVVTVPAWRRADTPEVALEHFRRGGPATGAVLFPIEAAATGLLFNVATSWVRRDQPGARASLLAAVSMAGTVVMLPLYFVRANKQLLARDCPPSSVPALLASWNRWNWGRTGLAVVATALAISSYRETHPEHRPEFRGSRRHVRG